MKEKAPEKAAAPAAEPEKPARTASLPSNVDVVDFLKDVLGQMGIDAEGALRFVRHVFGI